MALKNIKTKFLFLALLSIYGIFSFSSCVNEDDYDESSSITLSFSTDTLSFDTIFTTLGSTTKTVKIYNSSSKPVLITTVQLLNGSNSRFRLNVDGDKNIIARDVRIEANDSLFIFVTVTINPDDKTTPFLVEDAIEFSINNKKQSLLLTAYGQNAIFHLPNETRVDKDGNIIHFSYAGCAESWKSDLPHVIYGNCIVTGDSTLTIEPGTKIYLSGNSALVMENDGKLVAEGFFDEKIIFQSIRQDGYYKDLPGQWRGLVFSGTSYNNRLNWLVIKNGITGISIDSTSNSSTLNLAVGNTIIENMSHAGILTSNAKIEAENLLIANCRNYLVSIEKGGDYQFYQCTFANYWPYDNRSSASLTISSSSRFPMLQALFQNCIVYGNRQDEVNIVKDSAMTYTFYGCLLKTTSPSSTFGTSENYNILNGDPKFVNIEKNDYHLSIGSAAIGRGYTGGVQIEQDLDNKYRNYPPSIGAYEYQ